MAETLNGKKTTGSKSIGWAGVLINQVAGSINVAGVEKAERNNRYDAAFDAMEEMEPRDTIEGMLVAQMIAAHNAAMECFRRAMIPEQTFAGRSENLSQANKLTRSYSALLEALNRHRGKGRQKITVEHVNVFPGGQAIVGTIGGGEQPGKIKDQPLATITAATSASMQGDFQADRESMRVASGDGL